MGDTPASSTFMSSSPSENEAPESPRAQPTPSVVANADVEEGIMSNLDTRSITDSAMVQESSLSELSEDLLLQKPKGIIGFLERVPLGFKLLIMVVVCLIGMTIVGGWFIVNRGIEVQESKNERTFVDVAAQVKQILLSNQEERRLAAMYLVFRTNSTRNGLLNFWQKNTVVANLTALHGISSDVLGYVRDARLAQSLQTIRDFSFGIPALRNQVLTSNISSVQAYAYISTLTTELLDFMTTLSTRYTSKFSMQYVLLLELREVQEQIYAFYILQKPNTTIDENFKAQLRTMVNKRDQLLNVITRLASDEMYGTIMHNVSSNSFSLVSRAEAYVFNATSGTKFALSSSIIIGYPATMSIFDTLASQAEGAVRNAVEASVTAAAVEITVVVCVFVATILLSIIINGIVSGSIAGPWKRLNMLQELMINRFVPKEFLRMIGCTKITDVKLGKHQVRDEIVVLQFAIQDFVTLVEETKMNHNQIVEFVNNHLGYFAPIVRNFRGHVDRYNKDGFVALFASPKHAIRAALELQRSVDVFNTKVTHISKPRINVAISILKSEKVLVSAIGEGDRVQECIVSNDYEISQKLLAHAFRLGVGIIVGESVKADVGKLVKYRLLGALKEAGKRSHIFEAISPSSSQAKRCTEFSKSVQAILSGKYSAACMQLESLMNESTDQDKLTLFMSSLAKQMAERTKEATGSVTVCETLKDKSLREAFGSYCEQERSQENLSMWYILEEFRAFSTESYRRLVAQKVLDEYLSPEASRSINLPATVRNEFKAKVESALFESPEGGTSFRNDDFFKGLQQEIEFVMNDAHKRFKASESFMQAFASSQFGLQPTCIILSLKESIMI